MMEKAFVQNGLLLEDLHSVTSHFELTKNPLAILFRNKNRPNLMEKFLSKISNTKIKHTNYSPEDIARDYSFINSEDEVFLTEIYGSYTCSNIPDLMITYNKLAEENNVHIINETDSLRFEKESSNFESKNYSYESRNTIISTSLDIFPNIAIQEVKGVKITTPIIEKFPRISLYDIDTASFMWLEEAGYFHIFRLFEELDTKDIKERTKDLFLSIFPHIETLEIVDETSAKILHQKSVKESIKRNINTKLIHFTLPIEYEFSLSAVLAENLSKIISKQEKDKIANISIKNLLDI